MNRTGSTAFALVFLGLGLGAWLAAASEAPLEFAFDGGRAETERLIEYYESIDLTAEQEAIRIAALGPLPAPCCSDFSAATCCCECNLSRATWGLSKYLITVLGYGAEEVREAVIEFHEAAGPNGFSGNSCSTGGCMRPFAQGGCGGMRAEQLIF